MPDFLIASAFAQDAANTDAAIGNILFMVLLFAIFYFLIIRPQQKQVKEHKEMVANLARGDAVVTGGGILGKVHRLEDDVVVVEIGEVEMGDRVMRPLRIKVRRSTITAVTAKTGATPEAEAGKAE